MTRLKEDLEEYFGGEFPIGAGTAKRDDPVVITEQRDYVSIEYQVAGFILGMMGLENLFERQQIHRRDGLVIDELIYATKKPGDPEWTETRRFFFDITIGFTASYGDEPKALEGEE